MRQATVYIDRQALQYNLNRVKQLAANSKIVSMVKANAYGHGVKDCLALMNPLMILVKIIKLRWIHILSYDQM
ncbi:alanine racemase, partial [Acinetobacter baumannii]